MINIQHIDETENSILITLENGENLLFGRAKEDKLLKITRFNQRNWDNDSFVLWSHEVRGYLNQMVGIPDPQAKPMTEIIRANLCGEIC